jgi:hypothetical protein
VYALFACACISFAFACATGGDNGNGNNDDASVQQMDAPLTVRMDAATTPTDAPKDASMPPPQDAFVPPPQDAPMGPFCSANSQCTVPGECCLMINGVGFCVPGTIVLDVCFPIT